MKRRQGVVAQPEAQHILVERHQRADVIGGQHQVPQPERPGAEAGDAAARTERRIADGRAVEQLEPVAGGVVEGDHLPHASLVGQGLRLAPGWHAAAVQMRRHAVQRGAVGDFPAEELATVGAVLVDDQPLLPVIHP